MDFPMQEMKGMINRSQIFVFDPVLQVEQPWAINYTIKLKQSPEPSLYIFIFQQKAGE